MSVDQYTQSEGFLLKIWGNWRKHQQYVGCVFLPTNKKRGKLLVSTTAIKVLCIILLGESKALQLQFAKRLLSLQILLRPLVLQMTSEKHLISAVSKTSKWQMLYTTIMKKQYPLVIVQIFPSLEQATARRNILHRLELHEHIKRFENNDDFPEII